VRCGTHRVFEDRVAKKGRTIDLNIVMLRATGSDRQPDRLFVLQGGPGEGVAQLAAFYGRLFKQLRASRDIVLVDLRGTGKSNLLSCPQLGRPDVNDHFDDQMLSPSAVAGCRQALMGRADLTKYTTEKRWPISMRCVGSSATNGSIFMARRTELPRRKCISATSRTSAVHIDEGRRTPTAARATISRT
jgi:hypothetical protein